MNKNILQGKTFWLILFGVTTVLFILYMVFFSDNNLNKRRELDKKIDNLEKSITDTKNKIENNYSYDQLKSDSSKLEQYGREKLNMQKKDEDVFVIVYE
ncbi:MAG: septum formation initiator family protein [Bacteroidales bacterium]|jgi:cell division protein FtsL|nr:septum formation initiator family protein [Bacteroidales bacterium]